MYFLLLWWECLTMRRQFGLLFGPSTQWRERWHAALEKLWQIPYLLGM